jgi:hypothetical protein
VPKLLLKKLPPKEKLAEGAQKKRAGLNQLASFL